MEGGGGGRDKSGHSAPATGSVARIESPRRAWAVVGSIAGRPFFKGWQTLFASLFFYALRAASACLPAQPEVAPDARRVYCPEHGHYRRCRREQSAKPQPETVRRERTACRHRRNSKIRRSTQSCAEYE